MKKRESEERVEKKCWRRFRMLHVTRCHERCDFSSNSPLPTIVPRSSLFSRISFDKNYYTLYNKWTSRKI